MIVTPLELSGLLLIELRIFRDERGFFIERYQQERFREHGLPSEFVQDNHSRSLPGILRGLHYQQNPSQGKLVGVIRGRIQDVVADLRPESPTFGKYVSVELSEDNGRLLWVPPGFAHGFCVQDNEPADVFYKVDRPYNAAGEGGIHWADPDLNIKWQVERPVISSRDQELPSFNDFQKQQIKW